MPFNEVSRKNVARCKYEYYLLVAPSSRGVLLGVFFPNDVVRLVSSTNVFPSLTHPSPSLQPKSLSEPNLTSSYRRAAADWQVLNVPLSLGYPQAPRPSGYQAPPLPTTPTPSFRRGRSSKFDQQKCRRSSHSHHPRLPRSSLISQLRNMALQATILGPSSP